MSKGELLTFEGKQVVYLEDIMIKDMRDGDFVPGVLYIALGCGKMLATTKEEFYDKTRR